MPLSTPVLLARCALLAPVLPCGGTASAQEEVLRAVPLKPGTTLELAFTIDEELRSTESLLLIDGEGGPPKPTPVERTNTRSRRVVAVDRMVPVADRDEPMLARFFEETSGVDVEVAVHNGETQRAEVAVTSEVADRELRPEGEDDAWVAVDGGESLRFEPDRIRARLGLEAWLPEEPMDEEWRVPAAALDELLNPGGDIGWHIEDDEDHRDGDRASRTVYEGTIRARRAPEMPGLAPGCVAILVDVDVVGTRDLKDDANRRAEREGQRLGGRGVPNSTLEATLEWTGEGTIVWDAIHGRLSSAELELEVEQRWRRVFAVEFPSGSKEYDQTVWSRGEVRLAAQCAVR